MTPISYFLVLSGILATQHALVADALRRLGINDFETTTAGEWIAVII